VTSDGTRFYNDIYHGLAYLLIVGIISELMTYPEDLYTNFILKERHGFNKMKIEVYISDKIKEYFGAAVSGVPTYYFFMKFVEWGDDMFYINVAVLIILGKIVTNVNMPLSDKYKNLEEGKLRNEIAKLATKIKFPLSKIYVVDASKKSAHYNAYFSGFGYFKRIVLYDTLLKHHQIDKDEGVDEVVAIVRHELGHWKYMHGLISIIFPILELSSLFAFFSLVINNHTLLAQFGFSYESNFVSFLIFLKC
jgi:STE24 endopeptidase